MMLGSPKQPTPEKQRLFEWLVSLSVTNALLWAAIGAAILVIVIVYAIIHYIGISR